MPTVCMSGEMGGEKCWGALVAKAVQGLRVTGAVKAEPCKPLIYDKGSFFVEHRATEKAPGVFATLIVALPSLHEGGERVVRQQGREAHADLRNEDPSEITTGFRILEPPPPGARRGRFMSGCRNADPGRPSIKPSSTPSWRRFAVTREVNK